MVLLLLLIKVMFSMLVLLLLFVSCLLLWIITELLFWAITALLVLLLGVLKMETLPIQYYHNKLQELIKFNRKESAMPWSTRMNSFSGSILTTTKACNWMHQQKFFFYDPKICPTIFYISWSMKYRNFSHWNLGNQFKSMILIKLGKTPVQGQCTCTEYAYLILPKNVLSLIYFLERPKSIM